jgi:RNA polymerase sigma-70 factor (sigma-E family)
MTAPVNTSGLAASCLGTMGAVQEGTSDAAIVLRRVYEAHWMRLVGLARMLLDDPAVAEDTVQEAFARTWAAWDRVRTPDDPLPYIRQTVINLSRGDLRRRGVARRSPVDRAVPADDASVAVLASESRSELAAAIRSLPRRQRECIALRYELDCTQAQIADELGISQGSVKAHLHRAMQALASTMKERA